MAKKLTKAQARLEAQSKRAKAYAVEEKLRAREEAARERKERNAQRLAQQQQDAKDGALWRKHLENEAAEMRRPRPASIHVRLPVLLERAMALTPIFDTHQDSPLNLVRCILIESGGDVFEGNATRVGFETLEETRNRARLRAVANAVNRFDHIATQEFNARHAPGHNGVSRADREGNTGYDASVTQSADNRARRGALVGAADGGKVIEEDSTTVYTPSPGCAPQVTETRRRYVERPAPASGY